MRLSVCMAMKPDRVCFLDYSLPLYSRQIRQSDDVELVVVEEVSDAPPQLESSCKFRLLKVFSKVRWVQVDKRRMTSRDPATVAVNISVRQASSDAVLITHPECLQLGTLSVALKDFRPDCATYFETYKSDATVYHNLPNPLFAPYFDLLTADGVDNIPFVAPWRPNCWFLMSALLSRQVFMETGGLAEVLPGWGCVDDVFGWMLINRGIPILINTRGKVIHLWHPMQEDSIPALEYAKNHQYCEYVRKRKITRANIEREWGNESAIVKMEDWTA